MGCFDEQAQGRAIPRRLWVFPLMILFLVLGGFHSSWAMQKHELTEGVNSADGQPSEQFPHDSPGNPPIHAAVSLKNVQQEGQPSEGHGNEGALQQNGPAVPHGNAPAGGGEAHVAPGAGHGQEAAEPGRGLPEHEGEHEGIGEHGPPLPQISPIPGVTFVETMIRLMDYELHGRFLGWRPNDLLIGRFTDDVNYYQLGVLEAIRFTTLRLKDSLTRMGDADAYDPDLEQALNLFMNRATLFWFPSAEGSYSDAIEHLQNFLQKLKNGQRHFYYRRDNLQTLLSAYKDLLGNVNKTLIASPVSWFKTDDYFYYAKGVAHVYYEILRVVRVGYKDQLASTMNATDIMDEIIHELYRAEQLDPWIVLDGDLDGFLANHRANLNAPLSEAAHLLGILSTL